MTRQPSWVIELARGVGPVLKWRALLVALLMLAILAVTVACEEEKGAETPAQGVSPAAGEPRAGGTLVVANEADFEGLDPHVQVATTTARVIMNHIVEPLMLIDMTSEENPPPFIPGLAQSWEVSDDGKVYTFHLAEGVKFHDGMDFNAEAVKWNVERQWDQTRLGGENAAHFSEPAAANADWRWEAAGLEEVEVVDELTVRFHLVHPFQPFLRMLAQTDVGPIGIISPKSFDDYGNEGINEHPVGTGPFVFKEWVPGERLVMERNDNYWNEDRQPYLDKIIYRIMPDVSARENALRAGEVDFVFAPNADSVAQFESDGFVVKQGPMPHIWVLLFNPECEIMNDERVRLAVQHGIDRKGMAEQLLRNTALPAESWFSRTSEVYDPNAKWLEYDPDLAGELLQEAEAEGAKLVFTTSTSGSGQMQPVAMGEWIQRDLNNVGFDVELKTFEWNDYLADFFDEDGLDSDWCVSQMSWGWSGGHWLNIFLDPNSPFNASGVQIPELGELINRAHQTVDLDEARDLYRQVDEMVKENAWWMPVVNDLAPVVMQSKVQNFAHTPDWQMGFFGQVWLSE